MGGLAVSEDSLHLFGNVGKCILSKDGWKTDSAIPGGIATRCKYKVLGLASRAASRPTAAASCATDDDDAVNTTATSALPAAKAPA